MKKLLSLAIILCLLLSLCLTAQAEDPKLTFRLSESQTTGSIAGQAMAKFAELVNEKTNGTVSVEVYTDGALGAEGDVISQLQFGTMDFVRTTSNVLAATDDLFNALSMPYLFGSTQQQEAILGGEVGQLLFDSLKAYDMVGLSWLTVGARCFYTTRKPITCAADLKGMKIRSQNSETVVKMMGLLNAVATPMDYGEVFQAMQTGVVDGAENDIVSYYTSGHYEIAKNYTLDSHMVTPAMILCSQKAWDAMSGAQQEAVKAAALEASQWHNEAYAQDAESIKQKLVDAGCQMFEVDTAEFQQLVAPMYADYPAYADIISAITANN